MAEITQTTWPGVRVTSDGRFSFTLNVCNTLYIQSGFHEAELAARGLDETKFHLINSGHMRRSNYFFFPEEVKKWEAGVEFPSGINEELRRFMSANQPRYAPLKERVETVPFPTPVKLFSAQQTIGKLLAATPSRLTAEERAAFQTALASLTTFLTP